MQGWTKLGAHARSTTSALETTIVFFSGKCSFSVLPSSLQSVIYSYPRRTSRFLESVATTRTTTMLAYNTRQITKFLAIHPVCCRVWHPENLLHRSTLRFMIAVGSGFCIIISYVCTSAGTCLDHELRTMWVGFRECLCAIKSCPPRVYPCDVTHVIKCTRFSPSLAGRAWERGYFSPCAHLLLSHPFCLCRTYLLSIFCFAKKSLLIKG